MFSERYASRFSLGVAASMALWKWLRTFGSISLEEILCGLFEGKFTLEAWSLIAREEQAEL